MSFLRINGQKNMNCLWLNPLVPLRLVSRKFDRIRVSANVRA